MRRGNKGLRLLDPYWHKLSSSGEVLRFCQEMGARALQANRFLKRPCARPSAPATEESSVDETEAGCRTFKKLRLERATLIISPTLSYISTRWRIPARTCLSCLKDLGVAASGDRKR